MIEKKQLKIEITGEEAREIVSQWAISKLEDKGYILSSSTSDSVWPYSSFIGNENTEPPEYLQKDRDALNRALEMKRISDQKREGK